MTNYLIGIDSRGLQDHHRIFEAVKDLFSIPVVIVKQWMDSKLGRGDYMLAPVSCLEWKGEY